MFGYFRRQKNIPRSPEDEKSIASVTFSAMMAVRSYRSRIEGNGTVKTHVID